MISPNIRNQLQNGNFFFFRQHFNKETGELDLSGKDLQPEDTLPLVKFLALRPGIKRLNISGNNIGDEGAKNLAEVRTLTHINAESNSIGDDGAISLSRNNFFEFLNLGSNSITDKGVQGFPSNDKLRWLALCFNAVGDQGAILLAKNTTLEFIDLSNNKIGDIGGIAFAESYTVQVHCANNSGMSEQVRELLLILQNKKNPQERMAILRKAGIKIEYPSLKEIGIFAVRKIIQEAPAFASIAKQTLPQHIIPRLTPLDRPVWR